VYFQPMNGGVPSFGAHRRFSVSTTDQTDPSVLYCSKPSSATVAFQCSHTSAIELHFSRLSVFFIALGTIVKFPQGQKNLLPCTTPLKQRKCAFQRREISQSALGKQKPKRMFIFLGRMRDARCRLVFQVEGREHGCCRCKPYNAGVTEEEFLGPGKTFSFSSLVPSLSVIQRHVWGPRAT
jgi:hypothetical protein